MRTEIRVLHLLVFITIFTSACARLEAKPEINRKLDLQWQKYQAARELVLANAKRTDVAIPQRLIARDKWEDMLALKGKDAWTDEDLKSLRDDQAGRIAKAKLEAERSSVIDLGEVRRSQMAGDFCARLPKGGMLHFHPWGAMDRQAADHLLQSKNPQLKIDETLQGIKASQGNAMLYPEEERWLEKLPKGATYRSLLGGEQRKYKSFLFLPEGKHPFPRFNSVFYFLDVAITDAEAERELLRSFANRAAREGVNYIEMSTGANAEFLKILGEVEAETGVMMRVHQSFRRTLPVAAIEERWRRLIKSPANKYLVGIDILDNEETDSALEKAQLLYAEAMLDGRMHRTMHAGEIGDIRNPRDAMILGAERLGHGVNLAKDAVALEYAARIHEPVEINISSNLRLSDVPDVEHHPFLSYLRMGLPVSLSTDDEGIFDTDINHECELAITKTDVTYYELKSMAFNSITTSFAADDDKKTLLAHLTARFAEFESSWQNRQKSLP